MGPDETTFLTEEIAREILKTYDWPEHWRLGESQIRLNAKGIRVAVNRQGKDRIVDNLDDIDKAIAAGGTIWSPNEMRDYIEAPPELRKVIRGLKGLK